MAQESTLIGSHLDTTIRSGSVGLRAKLRVPGLTILAHPSILRIGEVCHLPKLQPGSGVVLSRSEPLFAPPHAEGPPPRPLQDAYLSRNPIFLESLADHGIRLRVEAPTKIVADGQRVRFQKEFSGEELARGIVLLLADRVALLLHSLDPLRFEGGPRHGLEGDNSYIVDVRRQISLSADMEVPVLVRGATGTGKELVARALHRASRRRAGPFVAVNLGGIAPALASAELFGVVKGAFTGADRNRKGCFERAKGGTLFLDEIGEAPSEVQTSLFRALETGRIMPVGAESEIAFNARIVAATDAALESAIARREFRAPLLHRLAGYEIHLPPLADRRDDIGRLLMHFLRQELESSGDSEPIETRGNLGKPWLPARLVARLARFDWPGNVRQLRNIVRRLVIEGRHQACLRWTPQIEELLRSSGSGTAEHSTPSAIPTRVPAASTVVRSIPGTHAADAIPGAARSKETRGLRALCLAASVPWGTITTALDSAGAGALRSRYYRELRQLLGDWGGFEVASLEAQSRLIFERPIEAVGWALEYQKLLRELAEEFGSVPLQGRVAIHVAELGMRNNTNAEVASGARVMEIVADGASERALDLASRFLERTRAMQILLTRSAFDLANQALVPGDALADPAIHWLRHGVLDLPESAVSCPSGPVEVFEVGDRDIAPLALDLEPTEPPRATRRPTSDISEDEMVEALRAHGFNLQSAADSLGISRTSLYKLVEKSSRVRTARDLEADEIKRVLDAYGPNLDVVAERLEVSRRALKRRMTELGLVPAGT